MDIEKATLLVLFGLTALNWTIHFYTQVVTYRLFGLIAEVAGGEGFVTYHKAYEARLVWSIYAPWSALVLVSGAYLAVSPSIWSGALMVANAAIAVISVVLAVPTHSRVDREKEFRPADGRALLSANLVRLVTATVSLVIVTALAWSRLV